MNRVEVVFRAVARIVAALFAPFGRRRQAIAAAYISENLVPKWTTGIGREESLTFWGPSYKPLQRGWSVLSKEPDTIAWIDRFGPHSVLWDIGANVGVFSLYAARRGHRVSAFEPEAGNYHVLTRNIEINRLDDNIQAYSLAFSDKSSLDSLNMRWTLLGSSHHQFGELHTAKGAFSPMFRQGCIGFSIDDFVEKFKPQLPDHIKIDVDGIELKIIRGGGKLLAGSKLKSLMIELQADQPHQCAEIREILEQNGFEAVNTRRSNWLFTRTAI